MIDELIWWTTDGEKCDHSLDTLALGAMWGNQYTLKWLNDIAILFIFVENVSQSY